MTDPVDTSFDFVTDSPPGRDPDSYSPTLRYYHQRLWSKPLPTGPTFTLVREPRAYLVHRSGLGVFYLASDAITTRLLRRAAKIIGEIPPAELPEDLGYTIGSSVLFPGAKVDGKMTVNGARGFEPRIADRFDLTLECIRRHYRGDESPLAKALMREKRFFALFGDFTGYVEFFLLQDLMTDDGQRVRFFHPFDDFNTPAVPKTVDGYLQYVRASNAFIGARNRRIDTYVATQARDH